MRLTLLLTLVFLSALWVTDFAMYFSRMGLDPGSVAAYYRGSEAAFTSPRSLASMLEVAHAHLPMQGLVLLLVTHLLIFAPLRDGTKYALIGSAFATALLNEGAGWLVRFVHPGFAWLKVASFLAFQSVLGLLLAGLGMFLYGAAFDGRARRKT